MTREALLNAKEAVESWGGEFVVFMIPVREEVYSDLTLKDLGQDTMNIYSGARETMLSLCEELDLRCLDLLPAMQDYARQGEHLYYTDDMHLNPRGNEIVAQLVRDWLVDLELIEGAK
jgi:lysophospholipase L1-like esterase